MDIPQRDTASYLQRALEHRRKSLYLSTVEEPSKITLLQQYPFACNATDSTRGTSHKGSSQEAAASAPRELLVPSRMCVVGHENGATEGTETEQRMRHPTPRPSREASKSFGHRNDDGDDSDNYDCNRRLLRLYESHAISLNNHQNLQTRAYLKRQRLQQQQPNVPVSSVELARTDPIEPSRTCPADFFRCRRLESLKWIGLFACLMIAIGSLVLVAGIVVIVIDHIELGPPQFDEQFERYSRSSLAQTLGKHPAKALACMRHCKDPIITIKHIPNILSSYIHTYMRTYVRSYHTFRSTVRHLWCSGYHRKYRTAIVLAL